MTKFNILMTTTATLLLASGCVKPAQQDTAETIYNSNPASTPTASTQGAVYEEPQSSVYQPSSATIDGGTIDGGTEQEVGTVITTPTQTVYSEGSTYNNGVQQGTGTIATTTQPTYGSTNTYDTNTYGTATTNYPDPYANGNANTSSAPVYNDPYATTSSSQSTISNYPVTTPSASAGATTGGGIHLQVAALKDYYSAQEYKNRLSLAPAQSAYIKRGAMNKVIVTGISSVSEANRLKESRFPGAFIVQGGTSGGYTPPVQPNYSTSGGSYSVNNPYGVSSSTSGSSGFGVQVGAFGSRGKADAVASNQSAKYPAKVKKIGRYYKVILTGFSSRSAAKAYAGRVNGFVVSY